MNSAASTVKTNTLRICVVGLGIALFVVLSLCLQVPVFENYYLCLGYVAVAIYCCSFGPLSGAAVGTLGCILYCVLISGLRGMPGWAAGNLLIGVVLGVVFKRTKTIKSTAVRAAVNAAAIVLSTAAGILIIKSVIEWALYAEPMVIRIAKNGYAFVADVVVLLVSLPICMSLDKMLQKRFPTLI